jgi:hypothetical protein
VRGIDPPIITNETMPFLDEEMHGPPGSRGLATPTNLPRPEKAREPTRRANEIEPLKEKQHVVGLDRPDLLGDRSETQSMLGSSAANSSRRASKSTGLTRW